MSTLCLAFDLDDTLYLERDYVRSGFDAVGEWARAKLGVSHFAEKAWELFGQGVRGTVFQLALQSLDLVVEPALISKMVHVYRNHRPDISLLPDAAECLRSLRGRATISIVTDGPLVSQRAKCLKLGLEEYCDPIVCTDQWGKQFCKPHPRGFKFVEARVGPGDFSFTYVGDNPSKDFAGPRSLGWNTVRVRRREGLHFEKQAPLGALPRIEVEDLSSLPEILGMPNSLGRV